MDIIQHPSPNFNDRPNRCEPSLIILHYTGMETGEAALERLCDPEAKVSAHYMIERDGRIFQLVAEHKRAWHAGVSSWGGETDINGISIGIELVNKGHEFGYQDFPNEQMGALIFVIKGIMARYDIAQDRVVGHSDVAPNRKEDPGEKFDWARLADESIGFWPTNFPKNAKIPLQKGDMGIQVGRLQARLAEIGYGIEITDLYDEATETVVKAFQRHWRQANISGAADQETQNIIDCVLKGEEE